MCITNWAGLWDFGAFIAILEDAKSQIWFKFQKI